MRFTSKNRPSTATMASGNGAVMNVFWYCRLGSSPVRKNERRSLPAVSDDSSALLLLPRPLPASVMLLLLELALLLELLLVLLLLLLLLLILLLLLLPLLQLLEVSI